MRNLKKILALVLALVLSLSLVTIASGADFNDADEITLTEAVDVMTTIGVFEGHNTGAFAPKGTLTREQAAKIITYMLLGENADKLSVGTSRYSDVAVTRWSAPAIEYCATLGIVAGNGDSTFNPAGTLTGYAFAKMLLTALGYKAETEGFTGSSWTINVARYALEVGLGKNMGGITWGATLTREQAAQMALNAIKAPLVAYKDGATIIINGEKVSFGSGDAYYVTTTLAKEQRIGKDTLSNSDDTYTVEFGERYFPLLVLDEDVDEFNRPAYTWIYDGEEICTYLRSDLLEAEYTTAIDGKDLYDLLGRTLIRDAYITYYVDGFEDDEIAASNMIRSNTESYDTTGNGVLTQVFVNRDAYDGDGEIIITSINTYLASVSSDYNENRETLAVSIYAPAVKKDTSISIEDVAGIEDYQQGDMLLVNVAYNGKTSGVRYDVVAVSEPEVLSNVKLTKYSENSYVVTGGEQYDYADTATGTDPISLNEIAGYGHNALTNYSYNLYLDQYGYMIGNEIAEGEDNYVFITAYDFTGSHRADATATATAIFLDGRMTSIEVNVQDTQDNIDDYNAYGPDGIDGNTDDPTNTYGAFNISGDDVGKSEYNRWFTYVVDDDVYTLTPADNWMNVSYSNSGYHTINPYSVRLAANSTNGVGVAGNSAAGTPSASSRSYGNDDSIYITVDTGSVSAGNDVGITEVLRTYTGVDNTNISVDLSGSNGLTYGNSIFAVYDEDLYIIGAIVIGTDNSSTDSYAYMLEEVGNEYIDDDNNHYWDVRASVDGTIQTLTVKTSVGNFSGVRSRIQSAIDAGKLGMMKVTYDADGYITDAYVVTDANTNNKLYGTGDSPATGDNNFGADVDPDTYNVYAVKWGTGTTLNTEANFTISGRTLWSSAGDAGLRLASGAPVIVVQPREDENGNRLSDSIETYSDFETAVESLANRYSSFDGWISAVIGDNGQATYVVISSNDPITVDVDTGEGRPSDKSDITDVALTVKSLTVGSENVGATLTGETATATYNWALKRNAPGQDTYVTIATGSGTGANIERHNWFSAGMAASSGYSYILSVDGVDSNPVYIP